MLTDTLRQMSIIMYHNEDQKNAAKSTKLDYEKMIGQEVSTQIIPYEEFYLAEEYHQKYLKRRRLSNCNIYFG